MHPASPRVPAKRSSLHGRDAVQIPGQPDRPRGHRQAADLGLEPVLLGGGQVQDPDLTHLGAALGGLGMTRQDPGVGLAVEGQFHHPLWVGGQAVQRTAIRLPGTLVERDAEALTLTGRGGAQEAAVGVEADVGLELRGLDIRIAAHHRACAQ